MTYFILMLAAIISLLIGLSLNWRLNKRGFDPKTDADKLFAPFFFFCWSVGMIITATLIEVISYI